MKDSNGMTIEAGMNVYIGYDCYGVVLTTFTTLLDIAFCGGIHKVVVGKSCTIIDLCDTLSQPTWRKDY